MLCYRCGSHVPDTTDTCPTCGQKFDAAARQAAGASARKRGGVEGAPYKAGDTLAKRFTIRELVGAGPVGYVFRALDTTHDVEVALKVINPRLLQEPEERTQFSLVLKVGKKLNHPYLSRVYEEGFDQDRPYFTAQLIEGMTLRRMMEMRGAKGQPFTLREVEPLLTQLGAALDAAHRYGPHSDLKPENVIVLPDVLKVTDYGLALGIPRPPFVQAQKGYRAEAYIAPEYVSGGEIDARMDIYSLAVIVGEMLTGLMPDADGIPQLLMKNPDLPPAFEALYRRALNANPLARPKTAGEFAAEFSAIAAKGPAALKRPSRTMPSLGNSALASTARNAEKPPPPVPTDQLPIASVSPPVVARPPAKEEAPVDATQPMDAAMLEAIMAAPPVPAAKPDGTGKPPDSRPAAEGRSGKSSAGEPSSSSSPAPAANSPRAPGLAAPAPRQPPKPGVAASRSGKKVEKRPMPVIWLVLLTIAGLVVGSAGGYLLLKRLRTGTQGGTLPVEPPSPGPGPLTTPPESAEVDPMAPAIRCPSGMKLVSGGTFKLGADPSDSDKLSDEHPLQSVEVGSFCVDEYEYPNKAGVNPRVNVSWTEAVQACNDAHKRLCTEQEWEKACKGPGNARFPYGNTFDASRCNADDGSGQVRALVPAGRFQQCRSAYQVADLSGNVAEWTASPFEGSSENKTQKGGAFDRGRYAVRCSARINGIPTEQKPDVGFRCCAEVQP
ncbi:MAG: protein kinase domain-containing protein [Hyalangium sp.]|uniref:protein kinase domain-containing protein n=1 Tax=Hyalangium sp. TaxID=2028555 RepID=UPI00389A11B4